MQDQACNYLALKIMAKVSKIKQKKTDPSGAASPSEPATRSPWNLPAGWSVALGLAVLGVLLLVLRGHLLDIPLERDEATYAYLGKQILSGKIPYRDVYEMKPPLLFYAYAALVALFGYSLAGLHWAALWLSFWNTAWVMAIGMRFLGRFYGFVAGLCYVLLVANPFASAVLAESELLVMGFVLPGLYAFLRWEQQAGGSDTGAKREHWWLFAGGFLLACGVLVKQSGIFFFGFPALLLVLAYWQHKPLDGLQLLRRFGWLAAGAALPVAALLALLAALGAWDDFWFWNVKYVQVYASGLKQELWKIAFKTNFGMLTNHFELYWILGAAGLAALLTPALRVRDRVLLLALAVFSFAAVSPGRRFYGHYWLQFLPALALLMGGLFYHLEKGTAALAPRLNLRPLLALLAALVLALPIVRYSPVLFRGDPDRLLRSMFPGNPFPEDKALADLIAPKLQAGDEVAILGSEPQYYVYLNRESPSRHFYMAILMRPIPEADAWQREALDSLVNKAPRFVVFNFVDYSWMPKEKSNQTYYQESYRYTRDHYRPIAWADMLSLSETKYVLDETEAAQYKPSGQRYVTVYERVPDTAQ